MSIVTTDSQHYADIAAAIREKNGEETMYKPSEMAAAIADISTGAALNFEVVGGTTEPTNPKENTIWINTDTEITGWVFDSAEPTSPAKGMVWFTIGTIGTGFNALTENGLHVYPNVCYQYTGSAWVLVEAMLYQAGSWGTFSIGGSGMLYDNGTVMTGVQTTSYMNNTGCSVSWESAYIQLKTKASSVSEVYAVFGPYRMTEITKLGATGLCSVPNKGDFRASLYVSSTANTGFNSAAAINTATYSEISSEISFSVELDVSALEGDYYIYIGTNTNGASWTNVRYMKIKEVKAV